MQTIAFKYKSKKTVIIFLDFDFFSCEFMGVSDIIHILLNKVLYQNDFSHIFLNEQQH